MRFEHKVSENTQIKVITDGVLLQEMKSDPLLSEYSLVMIDDCHEQTMNTDMILGLLKKIRRKREDSFRIVVSSATLNASKYVSFFDERP